MKIFSVITLLLALSLSHLSLASDQDKAAKQMVAAGALVIDVRTTQEYAEAHLANSVHIPYRQIVAQLQHLEVRKDRPVVLYCLSGGRAGIAKEALMAAGYSQVVNGGGIEELQE
ncbi:MAG: rhodanese-like domain-containing protein [Halopseudomonas sp.]